MFRVVQKAPSADAPLCVLYLVGPQCDPALRSALPTCAIVASSESPLQPTKADLAGARALAGSPTGGLVLGGFSAGCQSVRALLAGGVEPAAIVTIDGTHSAMPPARAHLNLWRVVAAEARRGERLWVATCCLQRYVERLASGRYAATSTVLAAVLDLPELAALKPSAHPLPSYPGLPVLVCHDGGLHLLAYGSTDCDKDAHGAQQRDVLPDVLRRFVAPWLAGEVSGPDTEPAPVLAPPEPSTLGGHVLAAPPSPLGARLVAWYLEEIANGTAETPAGSNTSERIREFLAPCRRRATEKLLSLSSGAWCSATYCYGCAAVALPGEAYPAPRCSGSEMVEDAVETRTWLDVSYARAGLELPEPGDAAIYTRGAVGSWTRHVCAVESLDADGTMFTLGGNEDSKVRRTERSLSDEGLLGFVVLRRR